MRRIGLVMTVLWAASSLAARADAPGAGQVAQLLELGERCSPQSLTAARRHYQHWQSATQRDADLPYAYALVLIRQRSFVEAAAVLDDWLKARPDDLPAWRTKLWVDLTMRKHSQALIDAPRTAAAIADVRRRDDKASAQDCHDTARLLGSLFAFIEGPHANTLPDDEVRRARQSVLARLPDERAAFEAGEESLNRAFVVLKMETDAARSSDALAHAAERRALEQQQQDAETAEVKIDYQVEKTKQETQARLADVGKDADFLRKSLVAMRFRLNDAERICTLLPYQIGFLERLLPNPNRIRQQNEMKATLAVAMSERAALTARINELNAQLTLTAFRGTAELGASVETAARISREAARVKRDQGKLERAARASDKSIATESRQTRALIARQQTFATFEPFPFVQEKQRILARQQP